MHLRKPAFRFDYEGTTAVLLNEEVLMKRYRRNSQRSSEKMKLNTMQVVRGK